MRAGWRRGSALGSVALLIGVLAGLCSLGRWTPAAGPLDGRWRVLGGSDSGQAWPAWMASARKVTFTFSGDRATVVGLFGERVILPGSVRFPLPERPGPGASPPGAQGTRHRARHLRPRWR